MIGLEAGELDRQIALYRRTPVDDGTAMVPGMPALLGKRWAKRTDAKDDERLRAAQQGQELTARFLLRWDQITRTIDAADFLTCDEVVFEIIGAKEWGGRRNGIEITAVARPDETLS